MRRPRLAPGFTVMTEPGTLWLVAGEDVRYRLGVADPAWLVDLLARCDGSRTIDELATHADARGTIERLYEERVLVDGTAAQTHVPVAPDYRVIGAGALAEALHASTAPTEPSSTSTTEPSSTSTPEPSSTSAPEPSSTFDVLVQDSLDHRALLAFNRAQLAARRRWMWITSGPGGRAYVGPLFVPDAGPCAACLLVHFKRLSPVPELYDVLLAHPGPIAATPFPDAAIATTAALARWKLSLVAQPMAAALYALHVIDAGDLTVSAHAPLADLECTECR